MNTYRLIPAEQLALRIRMIMGGQKMSRRQLAREVGISRPSMTSKLDGKVSFTYDELIRVVQALRVDPIDLLTGPEEEDAVAIEAEPVYVPIRLRDFAPHPYRAL